MNLRDKQTLSLKSSRLKSSQPKFLSAKNAMDSPQKMETATLAQGDKEVSYCPIVVELRRASCYGYKDLRPVVLYANVVSTNTGFFSVAWKVQSLSLELD